MVPTLQLGSLELRSVRRRGKMLQVVEAMEEGEGGRKEGKRRRRGGEKKLDHAFPSCLKLWPWGVMHRGARRWTDTARDTLVPAVDTRRCAPAGGLPTPALSPLSFPPATLLGLVPGPGLGISILASRPFG